MGNNPKPIFKLLHSLYETFYSPSYSKASAKSDLSSRQLTRQCQSCSPCVFNWKQGRQNGETNWYRKMIYTNVLIPVPSRKGETSAAQIVRSFEQLRLAPGNRVWIDNPKHLYDVNSDAIYFCELCHYK